MVRLSVPDGVPAAASRFPLSYRQRRENGKGAEPESPGFGKFRELRESGHTGSRHCGQVDPCTTHRARARAHPTGEGAANLWAYRVGNRPVPRAQLLTGKKLRVHAPSIRRVRLDADGRA